METTSLATVPLSLSLSGLAMATSTTTSTSTATTPTMTTPTATPADTAATTPDATHTTTTHKTDYGLGFDLSALSNVDQAVIVMAWTAQQPLVLPPLACPDVASASAGTQARPLMLAPT